MAISPSRYPMRPGTLVVIVVLLVALVGFAFFLFGNGDGRPVPGRPPPTSVSP